MHHTTMKSTSSPNQSGHVLAVDRDLVTHDIVLGPDSPDRQDDKVESIPVPHGLKSGAGGPKIASNHAESFEECSDVSKVPTIKSKVSNSPSQLCIYPPRTSGAVFRGSMESSSVDPI